MWICESGRANTMRLCGRGGERRRDERKGRGQWVQWGQGGIQDCIPTDNFGNPGVSDLQAWSGRNANERNT